MYPLAQEDFDPDEERDEFDWHLTKDSEGNKDVGFGMSKFNSEAYLRYLKEVCAGPIHPVMPPPFFLPPSIKRDGQRKEKGVWG